MKTVIGANNYQLYGKLLLLLIFSGISIVLSFMLYKTPGNGSPVPYFVIPLFYLFTFFIFIQLLFLPIGVEISESEKSLTIKFLFRKKRLVKESDIIIYSPTRISTKSELYDGLLIDLKDGKQVLLSKFSLKDYTPVTAFLESNKLIAIEKREFKPFRYYTNCV